MKARSAAVVVIVPALLALAAAQKTRPMPAPGQEFFFEPGSFRYYSADIEFRDPTDRKWPNFFYGKPAGGTHRYDPAAPQASFTVVFDKMAQPRGDQSRKVLGELCKGDAPPTVSLTVSAMKPPAVEKVEVDTGKGKVIREVELCELDAVLAVGDRKINIRPKASFNYHASREGAIERVSIEARFTIHAAALGLKDMPGDSEIAVRFCVNGSVSKGTAGKK